MKNLIKIKSKNILIILQIFIFMLGLLTTSNTYAIETITKQIEISKVEVKKEMSFITAQDKPIFKKKQKKKNRTWLFIVLASLLLALSFLATSGVALLAFIFAWYDYLIAAIITLILGIPAVALLSIFSSKKLIKHFFKKDKSVKQAPPLSDNKQKNRWAIFGIVSAIIGLTVPIIYFLFFS